MIEGIFPTPVYYEMANDFEVLNSHIDKVIDKIDFNLNVHRDKPCYISTDFKTHTNIIKEYRMLHKVEKEIYRHVREYCSELEFDIENYKYEMESWFTKCKKGNSILVHHHAYSDISGVYYYKTNGDDGDFFYESPNPFLGTNMIFHQKNRWCLQWQYKPQVGKILLFPGWIRHGVIPNKTDNTRISLSFNINFKQK